MVFFITIHKILETVDLISLIPPPLPLPAIMIPNEDYEQMKFKTQITTPNTGQVKAESFEIQNFSQNTDSDIIKSQKFLDEILASGTISDFYNLEFSLLYFLIFQLKNSENIANPIVYSRNGKIAYNSQLKSSENYCFSVKDLQNIMSNNTPRYKFSFINSLEKIPPYYIPYNNEDTTLVFESRFESGNLGLVAKINENEYKLILQNDTLTKGNNQCIFLY